MRLKNSIQIVLLVLLFGFGSFTSQAQTQQIDSLRNKLILNPPDSEKCTILLALCGQYFSLSSDSLLHYIELGKKIIPIGTEEDYKIQLFYCSYLSKIGETEKTILIADSLLKASEHLKSPQKIRIQIRLIRCSALIRNNQSKEAIELSYLVLQDAELIKDTLSVIKAYTLLGWANMEIGQFQDAIQFLNKGFHYCTNENIIGFGSNLFNNLASSYGNINKFDSAFYFIDLGLKSSREKENLASLANALNIQADLYLKQKKYDLAENDLQEALKVRKKIGDVLYLVADMAQLSSFYAYINQPEKGIDVARNGIILAKQINSTSKLIYLYSALAENYKKANKIEEYANSLETIINLKDTLYRNNSEEAIAKIGAKYELQKKENIIIKQQFDLNRSKYFRIGTAIFFILCGLLIILFYRNYQLVQKRKLEALLAEQKNLAIEAVIAAEENERKRIAADLHDNLGSYAAAITSNVKYLKEGILNKDNIISQLDENARSMVTQLSDTIWVLKNEHLLFTQLADRYKVWMLRLMQNYPDVKYNYSENIIDDVEFAPVKILNIFLMLKECINNALKHSKCTELTIHFTSNKTWEIKIEDNGIGFILNNMNKGHGIKNVLDRAYASGWNVEWQTIEPHGTCVLITSYTTK